MRFKTTFSIDNYVVFLIKCNLRYPKNKSALINKVNVITSYGAFNEAT